MRPWTLFGHGGTTKICNSVKFSRLHKRSCGQDLFIILVNSLGYIFVKQKFKKSRGLTDTCVSVIDLLVRVAFFIFTISITCTTVPVMETNKTLHISQHS